MKFTDLPLTEPLMRAVSTRGYQTPTPIQAQTIPHTLAGRDVLGCAQTGTGKTAAFALPILQRLIKDQPKKRRPLPRALVLAPTRELSQQIAESFQTYGQHLDIYGTVIYGGVGQGNQIKALRRGVDIVVATPGRLLDLINQGHCDLSAVHCLVLDEADRMLDMGFMPDIKRIISHLPNRKQVLLFSATMPREIRQLASKLLDDPAEVTVAPESPAVERIRQSVYHVERSQKLALLAHLMDTLSISRAIVFTRTKYGADRLAKQLKRAGTPAEAIHGNKSQNARQRTMTQFRSGKIPVLVATDIAARGIDVDGISHVFNYDIARDPEGHIHRIGRTARAGAEGEAISLCDPDELPNLQAIERLIRMKLQVVGDGPATDVTLPVERVAHPLQRTNRKPRQNRGPAKNGPRKHKRNNARQKQHHPGNKAGARRRKRVAK